MQRRDFFTCMLGGLAVSRLGSAQTPGPFIERSRTGLPHKGKVLAAIQPHSDDIALICAGTVAKLINEGYTGYMIRATNDDMGDDVGEPGSVGENVLRNEREVAAQSLALGLKKDFGLNYNNHRMSDISRMAGRVHDYPEQLAAGMEARAVTDKYYYARHPTPNRIVDITGMVEKKIDANLCNVAKGPGGHHGSRLRAELAKQGKKLPLLGDDDRTADRNYIREFVLAGDRALGKKYGVEYAEAFHYVGPVAANIGGTESTVEDYVKQHSVPVK